MKNSNLKQGLQIGPLYVYIFWNKPPQMIPGI